ncbi:hypothetical protein DFH08DRAFT_826713 [Mycena albidolilacea]|uniref:Uncharacterized protein n=1 Tax=Mycena albidolilacea TaxID=1033008 RepID=A0AAD6Z0K9_9AGAR|nr:hypothetical protein DFH08DRAFT_826713 [Mycena albidolilacea]
MPPRSKQPQELPQAADAPTALPAQGRTSQRSTRSSNSLPSSTMPPMLPNQGRAPSTRRSSNAVPSVPSMPQATGTGPAHARAALNPITEETISGSPQNTFTSQTPAARVASHLLGQFDATTTSMASPGPRRGNRGHYSDDEESPDSEDLPPIAPPRCRTNIRPGLEGEPARGRSAPLSSSEPMEDLSEALNTVAISLNSDSDDDNSPIPARRTQPSRQQQQPAPRRNARTASGSVPGPTGPAMGATDRSHGHIIDADKFAWSTDGTLKNSKSPDASYFFGKNIERH